METPEIQKKKKIPLNDGCYYTVTKFQTFQTGKEKFVFFTHHRTRGPVLSEITKACAAHADFMDESFIRCLCFSFIVVNVFHLCLMTSVCRRMTVLAPKIPRIENNVPYFYQK